MLDGACCLSYPLLTEFPPQPRARTQPAMPLLKPTISPPRADQGGTAAHHHGIDLVDPYAWLREENWQEAIDDPALLNPAIRAQLEAENAYTQAALAGTEALQAELRNEMRGRIADEDATVPEVSGPWAYYEAFTTGAEHHRLCRMPAAGGPGQVMLDCDAAARGKPFWKMEEAIPSPDHRLLAYAFDPTGSERCNIRIRDLATGKNLTGRMSGAASDLAWSADSGTLFYVKLDRQQRPMEIWRHRIGRPAGEDVLVFKERDAAFEVGVGVTQSGRYILIETHAHDASEIWIVDAGHPESPARCVAARSPGHQYSVDHADLEAGDQLVIATNSAGANDYRLCIAPVNDLAFERWREIVPHVSGRRIVDVVAYKHHVVRLEHEDGLPRIVVRRWPDGAEHAIAFAEEAYDLYIEEGLDFDTGTLRFVYSSMTTPEETFDYDMEKRTRVLKKRVHLPSGHDPGDYVTRRLHARASDGEEIPISVLYHRSTPLDGTAPLLLNAYGAYGDSMDAEFEPARLSLVDRGFVFAIAHVRGGEDKGQRWHALGRHRHKMNTFTDFIAVGEHLAAEGFTARGRIVANGESAGGMLMGVVANIAPELFLAIIADVPFVDVLNTMLDPDLPMTPAEWPEWGNPITSKADFELIRSYCPYQNVKRQAYPHILVNASMADLRVCYWEQAKWVAKLREMKTDANWLLLDVNMTAGHAGAAGRFQRLDDLAFDYAFALEVAGKG
jgi:oligopeptidase B